MKLLVKTLLIAVVIQLSAGLCFAADAKSVKSVGEPVKEAAQAKVVDTKTVLVDINSASEAQLKSIPGIGDAYAAKIIAGRPYANKAQLKSRNVLPVVVYEQVKEKIIAKQVKK